MSVSSPWKPADGAEARARRPIREDVPMEIIRTACPPRPVRTLSSRSLLAGDRTLRIAHDGEVYVLRLTRNGRLILTK
jgi:hemin uptake protein HemP